MRYFKIDMGQHNIEFDDDEEIDEATVTFLENAIQRRIEEVIKRFGGVLAGGIGLVEVDGETSQAL